MKKTIVFKSLEEAYDFALPYVLSANQGTISERIQFREAWSTKLPQLEQKKYDDYKDIKSYAKDVFADQTDPVPRHATSSRWQITPETLRNTLSYIYDKMAHRCYMLCVNDDGMQFCKLQHTGLSPSFDRAIQEQLENMDYNKLITSKHRSHIRKVAEQPMRVMQCILKNQTADDDDEGADGTTNEYMTLLQNLVLPRGVFILNLTDAVILHRENREPFPMVTGDLPIESRFQHRFHLPILSISGQENYSDIPIPNYDDIFIILGMKDMKFDEYTVDWDQKTEKTAIFRGGPSGCGYTAETNQRIHLASMKSPLLDAKIVGKGNTIDSNSIKFDPVHGIGMLNTGIKPGNFVSMAEQSKHKYIIHVDGNVHAYRLLTTMMTGSLVIRVESPYISWVDHLIKPGQHYVLVKPDLSDLLEKIRWCDAHPKSARKMARAGYEFAKHVLTYEYMEKAIEKIFWSLPNMSRFARIYTRRKIARFVRKSKKTEKIYSPKSPAFAPPPSPRFSPISPAFSPPSSSLVLKNPEETTPLPWWKDPNYVQESPEDSPPLPWWKDPNYVPTEPEESPPPLPKESSTSLATVLEKSIMPQIEPLIEELDIIEFPPGAKKCPVGYNVVTINGKKMCKRKKNK